MNRKLLIPLLLLSCAAPVAAQESRTADMAAAPSEAPPEGPPPGPPPGLSGGGPRGAPGYVSPMGEPVRGIDGTEIWFRAADADHDDALSSAEFIADARRFFKTLDSNGDGEIDADEMKHYEEEVLRPARGGPRGMGGPGGRPEGGPRAGPNSGPPGGGKRRGGPPGMLEQPQPVASADTDMNRRVTADEFDKAAMRRFQRLDADQNRRVTLDEVRRAQ